MVDKNEAPAVSIMIKTTEDGYLVEWVKDGVAGSVGPYLDEEMAQRVLAAKRVELTENPGQI